MLSRQEIYAFYDFQERNPLTSSATSLWFTLAYTHDKAGCPDSFETFVAIACGRAGFSERTFFTARKELINRGLLEYDHELATYRLVPLSKANTDHGASVIPAEIASTAASDTTSVGTSAPASVGTTAPASVTASAGTSVNTSAAITHTSNHLRPKSNKSSKSTKGNKSSKIANITKSPKSTKSPTSTKRTKSSKRAKSTTLAVKPFAIKTTPTPLDLYEELGFGKVSSYVAKEIELWQHHDGFSDPQAMLAHAMDIAIQRGRKHWRYVTTILENWRKNGYRTVLEAKAGDRKRIQGGINHDQRQNTISRRLAGDFFAE
ncbi:DnaD domain protein [Alteribacillus iranensis]|uniref:DnaD and phage-associated domain-containing protein n=1 Tax=Alteribacillus iranensis TaxID=930128 RepID=A0A1I2BT40_9BACI|nr:DnaD domain protein [Alteribacillus iranensis]SFE59331.1 DnaD and phage-associated domain-containing protein [Alteribacillus iranensis]